MARVAERVLVRILSRLTDRALAESVVGDLTQERHRRARSSPARATLWFASSAAAIVCRAAAVGLRDMVVDLSLRRLGASGAFGEGRQAFRALRRTPVSTAVIVATLALGIGVNTAVYSVVYGVLFQPLPFADPDRIVMLEGATGDRPPSIFGNSLEDFRDLARDARTFAGLGAAGYWTFNLTDLDYRSGSSVRPSVADFSRRSAHDRCSADGSPRQTTAQARRSLSSSATDYGNGSSADAPM